MIVALVVEVVWSRMFLSWSFDCFGLQSCSGCLYPVLQTCSFDVQFQHAIVHQVIPGGPAVAR